MIQKRQAWPLGKDDLQNHEAFHIFNRRLMAELLVRWFRNPVTPGFEFAQLDDF